MPSWPHQVVQKRFHHLLPPRPGGPRGPDPHPRSCPNRRPWPHLPRLRKRGWRQVREAFARAAGETNEQMPRTYTPSVLPAGCNQGPWCSEAYFNSLGPGPRGPITQPGRVRSRKGDMCHRQACSHRRSQGQATHTTLAPRPCTNNNSGRATRVENKLESADSSLFATRVGRPEFQ